jgi:hypothetical protein
VIRWSVCPEARGLLAEYMRATREHARTTKYLVDLAGKTTPLIFSEALVESEMAYFACECARSAFTAHKAKHAC